MRTTEGIVRSLQMKNLSGLEIKTLTYKLSHVLWYIIILLVFAAFPLST
jgi:hypothetical protein